MSQHSDAGRVGKTSRREFIKTTTTAVVAGSVAAGLQSGAHAAGRDVLRLGLIGCGGRGTGAAKDALNADPNTVLVAMGDTFADRVEESRGRLERSFPDRVSVDADHRFSGFDSYQKVIDSCDVVLLATPPHFRPAQLKAAIDAGKHVFCEKPVAVDAPGVRSVFETSKLAKEKGLSIVSGLCWRYHPAIRATFDRVKAGDIGDIVAMQCSYNTQGLWSKPRKPSWSDMEWQIRNWLYFTWLSGDFITEQHVHSLDKMTWAMNDQSPLKASGLGGRQVRIGEEYGNAFDHFAVEYEYESGVKAFSRCRQQDGCQNDITDHLFGTKGRCDISSHRTRIRGGVNWKYKGPKGGNMYELEHAALFAGIRSGDSINNGHYMAVSTMMAIMGRMAAYTGQTISWEQALASQQNLTPPKYEWGSVEVGPIAMPGMTPFV